MKIKSHLKSIKFHLRQTKEQAEQNNKALPQKRSIYISQPNPITHIISPEKYDIFNIEGEKNAIHFLHSEYKMSSSPKNSLIRKKPSLRDENPK